MTKVRGLESSSQPTCYTQYPPGCTVLECRFDGNQPVAHVVHMPSDCSPTPAMCLVVETSQSPNGPFSRVVARPEKNVTTRQVEMSYHLESRKGPKGAVATAGRSPAIPDSSSAMSGPPVTVLETTKTEGLIARVLYHPTEETKETETESCSQQQQVATHIECRACPKGTVAKVTQCSPDEKAVNRPQESPTCFESFVKEDGTCTSATATKGPFMNYDSSPKSEVIETKIVNGAVTAKGLVQPSGTCLHLESRPCEELSSVAKINQVRGCNLDQFLDDTLQRSKVQDLNPKRKFPCPPETKEKNESFSSKVRPSLLACPKSCISQENPAKRYPTIKPAALSRRNGLDPTPSEIEGKEGKFKYLKPIKKTQRPRVCPSRCPVSDQFDADSLTKGEASNSKIKAHKVENFCEREIDLKRENYPRSDTDIKLKNVEGKSQKKVKPVRENNSSFQEIPLPSPDELLTDYREYLSDSQVKKYQHCAAKRNGLQDECYLSVPHAVVQIKREEMRIKQESS